MAEPMAVRPEVWPLAVDRAGVWLVSGDEQWSARMPVAADGDVHADVEYILTSSGAPLDEVALLHSTSWRQAGPATVLTYVAVLRVAGPVRARWPHARPVSPLLPGHVGRPAPHAATAAPEPRDVDVLLHALRHLAFLRGRDATVAEALAGDHWERALGALEGDLAGLYVEPYRDAA